MAALKLFICVSFLGVLAIQGANAALIFRQISDLGTNNTLDFLSIDNIEAYTTLTGESQDEVAGDGFQNVEQTELEESLGLTKIYTLGKMSPGDKLVGHGVKALNWSTPHNVRITLHYPARGTGALLHYVYIVVNQTNNSGRAYVVNGGLNRRYMTLVVEAYAVTHIALAASLYGQ